MLTELASFDRTETVRADLVRPDRYRQLFADLEAGIPVIPRGAGLSYCAASAGDGCRSVSSRLFDRILHFDSDTGRLVCEAGVSVGRLLAFAFERGWRPPVLPGHPRITVGGCVAFHVHGKSHRHGGNFGDWVRSLRLFHPDHGEFDCSPDTRPDVFALTVGGMGLTGFITRVELQLVPPAGGSVERRRLPARNLDHAVELMVEHAPDADAVYSWNDLHRFGDACGRGVVYVETPHAEPLPISTTFRSLEAGGGGPVVYRRWLTTWMNRIYGVKERWSPSPVRLDAMTAAFPIHHKEAYYRAFGRVGFREYQLLVPWDAWPDASREIRRLLATHRQPFTLGSLKLFDGERDWLHFSGRGVCLALDVPARPEALRLFEALDAVVADCGGVVNLSKDSRIDAELVQRLFPRASDLHRALRAFDPQRRIDSSLRRRIFDEGRVGGDPVEGKPVEENTADGD